MSSKNKMDAEERFLAFAKTLPGAEYIDEMDLTPEQKEVPAADGWSHRVDVKLVKLKIEFGNKSTS